jgi:hypothetical protein
MSAETAKKEGSCCGGGGGHQETAEKKTGGCCGGGGHSAEKKAGSGHGPSPDQLIALFCEGTEAGQYTLLQYNGAVVAVVWYVGGKR